MIEGKIADDGGHDSQDNDQHNYGNDNEFPAEEPSVDEPQKRTPPHHHHRPRLPSGSPKSLRDASLRGRGIGYARSPLRLSPEIFASRITSHDHATRSARIFIRVCILLSSPLPPLPPLPPYSVVKQASALYAPPPRHTTARKSPSERVLMLPRCHSHRLGPHCLSLLLLILPSFLFLPPSSNVEPGQ